MITSSHTSWRERFGDEARQTDVSLRAERAKSDAELAQRRAKVEEDADGEVRAARERADDVLRAARQREDQHSATRGAADASRPCAVDQTPDHRDLRPKRQACARLSVGRAARNEAALARGRCALPAAAAERRREPGPAWRAVGRKCATREVNESLLMRNTQS